MGKLRHDLGIVTMFRDEAPYLAEWVEYHLLTGVTQFWLYDHLSSDDSVDVLAPYVDRGIVTIIPWCHPYQPGDLDSRRRAQMSAYRDGITRAIGRVGWVALIDVDEFLLPMRGATVPRCLEVNFHEASGVYANWRMFGTSRVIVPNGDTLLDRLTACSLPSHPENRVGKSVVRPDRVIVEDAWYPHHVPLQSGALYVDGAGRVLSFNGRGDLLGIGAYADTHLRVNHYNLRDESYYWSRRLREARCGHLNKSLARLGEHYVSFGRTRDRAILRFLERHHRDAYDRIWGSPHPAGDSKDRR